jgi:tetratricopeptide (TPR) repeat protein
VRADGYKAVGFSGLSFIPPRSQTPIRSRQINGSNRFVGSIFRFTQPAQSRTVPIFHSSSQKLHCTCCNIAGKDSCGHHFAIAIRTLASDNTRSSNSQVYRYSREDLIRILRVSARQLVAWERAGLLTPAESYTFFDLLQVKKVRDLCARHVRPIEIRQSLTAMQKQAAGMENPLLETSALTAGRHRIAFRHQGKLLEPIAGQFMFDFSPEEKVIASVPTTRNLAAPDQPAPADVADLFARGVALEEDPRNQLQAIAAYERVLELDPEHAAAHINLGTLYYNRQDYGAAEEHYRHALRIDSRYALAHFDLGNVLDETGRVAEAIQTYLTALQLAPTYADAHYNLALAYEKIKEPRKALKHWQAYVKLDATGPWSVHARSQIKRILKTDSLKLVHGANPETK